MVGPRWVWESVPGGVCCCVCEICRNMNCAESFAGVSFDIGTSGISGQVANRRNILPRSQIGLLGVHCSRLIEGHSRSHNHGRLICVCNCNFMEVSSHCKIFDFVAPFLTLRRPQRYSHLKLYVVWLSTVLRSGDLAPELWRRMDTCSNGIQSRSTVLCCLQI